MLILSISFSYAQELFLVQLKAKENTSTYLENPLQMLSQRSLDRRAKFNVNLDEKDVPISSDRIEQVKQLNLDYVGQTKWLNTIMVEVTDNSVIPQLESLTFVESVKSMVRNTELKSKQQSKWAETAGRTTDFDYGRSERFISQINIKPLHDEGFQGQGVFIGVIDAGFPGVNTISAFENLRNENRIVDTYDFVDNKIDVYDSNSHGTNVLSAMGAEVNGTYVGTAPKATFLLYRSEDSTEETPKELLYWIQAAERADSVGVDLINTSLGYNNFDDSRYNFSYSDMDGKTSLISLGAQVAADKAILLVIAAGNDGRSAWKYILTPADLEDAFTVGANDRRRNPAVFSSFGPNANNVLKPNVSALGQLIPVYNELGEIRNTNGTSIASPVTAGAMAVMLQKFPTTALNVLKQKVQESAHLYTNPSNQLGYGVPDYSKVSDEILSTNDIIAKSSSPKVYPNPFTTEIKIEHKNIVKQVEIFNLVGQTVVQSSFSNIIKTGHLKSGVYIIKITDDKGNSFTDKIIKK